MASTVIHQPRVAWDGARAFVHAAQTHYADVFAAQVRDRIGPEYAALVLDTRDRLLDNLYLTGGDRHRLDVEAGRWRFRLEDLLRNRPDLTTVVAELAAVVPRV